jgi:hypothetical protein
MLDALFPSDQEVRSVEKNTRTDRYEEREQRENKERDVAKTETAVRGGKLSTAACKFRWHETGLCLAPNQSICHSDKVYMRRE